MLLSDRVVIRLGHKEGRIISADQKMYLQGEIVDFGSTKYDPLKKGQKVLFGKFAGMDYSYNGEKVKIIRETDMIAEIDEWI